MLRNYITIAWRNMMKNKFFSFVNIFGLSAGLACCMLIALYLKYETSYDGYQTNMSSLYQVGTTFVKAGSKDSKTANSPAPLAPGLKQEFPEIMESAKLLNLYAEDKTLIQYKPASGEKKSFLEDKGYLTDPSFFKMFTYNFIQGSPANALNTPNTIVISEDLSKKLFGDEPALNKVIHVNSNTNGEYDYTITGVFRPNTAPSNINANFFMSFEGGDVDKVIKARGADFATNNMFFTYIQLRPDANPNRLEAKFPSFIRKYADNDLKRMGFYKKQFLIPLKDIHLTDTIRSNTTPPASKTYLYILASIAIFTLLIACINFMNLATARSSTRSSEVGVRKVLGAGKGSLIRQFLGESLLMTLLAFTLALALTFLMLPLFNAVSGKLISFSITNDGLLLLGFLLLAVVTGLIAGSYPAFYLSSFNPVKVLKGKLTNSLAVTSIRKGLVVFQFIISIVLIISTVVIARQMNYLRNADLGFDKDQQIVVPLRSASAKAVYTLLKAELKNNTKVLSVGATLYYPGISNTADNSFYKDGQTMNEAKHTRLNWVDPDFMKTLNFTPVAGRLFSEQFAADTGFRIILNESAVKEIGFPSAQKAIGNKVYYDWQGKRYGWEIIGVVKDFHFEDLHLPVTPYGFNMTLSKGSFNYAIIHAKAGNAGTVLQTARNIWKKYDSNEPFEYTFLDEDFQKNYAADNRLASLVSYFTVIAIIISCLGLFGLATFSAEQRTKEIGVRKVLGASVGAIVSLLSFDFLKLILLSAIIASPLAWYVMNKWLTTFSYKEPLSWTVFADTTVIVLVIGLMTIGYQSIKAAIANPVKSLRSE